MGAVAIIGSGATGYVAAETLAAVSSSRVVHVFHGGPEPKAHRLAGVPYERWSRDDFELLHDELRGKAGFAFPPPKSHFGELVPRHVAPPRHVVWNSCGPGGLTRYWSASLLPFTTRELAEWGVEPREFESHYRWVAERVGLAAREDGLNRYFGQSFGTRPPIGVTRLIDELVSRVDARAGLVAGFNRVALETRAAHPRACVLCGGCFYGCPSESIWSGAEAVRSSVPSFVDEKVLRAHRIGAGFELETAAGRHGPYEKVFCAAGCVGTAELVARSFLPTGAALPFVDNELFIFPIFYLGKAQSPQTQYLAIANALLGVPPEGGTERYAEAHVAPIPDLLTRFYLPARLDRVSQRLARWLRGRVLLAKLYLHSDTAAQMSVTAAADGPSLQVAQTGRGSARLPALLGRVRNALRGTEFFVPSIFPTLRSKTSSHYAGSLSAKSPYAADQSTGEVAPGFHVLDSSLLPFSPAQPLTFTAMANAHRLVQAVA